MSSDRTGVFAISVAADMVSMEVQNLRVYERRGLIAPARTPGGTRLYSRNDLDRLIRIRDLLTAGLNLAGTWASREAGIWVVGRELLRGARVDESLVKQPLDGPALGSNITQGVPRRDQFGVVLIDLVLESPERSPPLQ